MTNQKSQQQTIGNTVYRVGQMIPPHELLSLPNGTIFEKCESTQPEHRCYLEITALPNPDPVAEDWREVEKGGHLLIKAVMEYPYIRIDWPEWSAAYRKYGAYTELDKQTESRDDYCCECEKFLIRAVALGGRVFVKGGE